MHFDTVAGAIDGVPHMNRKQGRRLYEHVIDQELHEVLELGCAHGVSTCYLAAAVDALGDGRVTTFDRVGALDLSPNIYDLADRVELSDRIHPIFAKRSFTWELRRLLQPSQRPQFDFVFIDGGHTWDVTGYAFFLTDLLLRPGGWMLFDDLPWTIASSPSVAEAGWAKALPAEERETPQVQEVFDLLVARDTRYETYYDGRWGWAQKVC